MAFAATATQLAQIGIDILLSLNKEVVIAQQLGGETSSDRFRCGLRFWQPAFQRSPGRYRYSPCGWLLDL